MFEELTYENLMDDVLQNAPAGIDTRQGSIFYDAVSGVMMKIAKLYVDIDMIAELVYIDSTTGEYLDRKAAEHSVTRLSATPAQYYVEFKGAQPAIGERFYTDGLYFVLKQADEKIYYLEAEIAGTRANGIYSGTAAIPVNNILGLTEATFGGMAKPGSDEESDDALRGRLREKMSGPAENGNRQHYKTWCESVPGVGRARIIPLFAGENTVMGVIIGTDGTPAAKAVVEQVQEYVDPITHGHTVTANDETFTVGDGLGDGVANIGAHFAAISPESVAIDIGFTAELKSGVTTEQIKAEAETAITDYLMELALNTPDNEKTVVRMAAVSAILYTLPGLLDYKALTLNSEAANIELTDRQIAVLGEVTVNAPL